MHSPRSNVRGGFNDIVLIRCYGIWDASSTRVGVSFIVVRCLDYLPVHRALLNTEVLFLTGETNVKMTSMDSVLYDR